MKVSNTGKCTCQFGFGHIMRVAALDLQVLSKATVQLNRMDTVKRLFHAHVNRIIEYNLPHMVDLTLFGSEVKVVYPLTKACESFNGIVST